MTAIREDIIHDTIEECTEDTEEFLPELLPRHFEDAVRSARRSVSDRDLVHYQSFARALFESRGSLTGTGARSLANFRFPTQMVADRRDNDLGQAMQMDDEDDLYS